MKIISAVLSFVFLAGTGLALQSCALMTAPVTTAVVGGTQLAIRGAELEKEIRSADVQAAIDTSFEKTWDRSIIALANLDIELVGAEKNREGDGGVIEGLAKKIKVKVAAVKLTEKITEIGIWADYDKALAELIAEEIKKEAKLASFQTEPE